MPQSITSQHKSLTAPDSFIRSLNDIPLQEIYQLLEDTAQDIAGATASTELWPVLILYLLKALESHTNPTDRFEERLVQVCEKVTRRLNNGCW